MNHGDETLDRDLRDAVRANKVADVALLIVDGANVAATSPMGRNCVHYAVLYAGPEIMELVLNESPDLEVRDADGKTALDLAEEKGKTDMIDMLKSAGAAGKPAMPEDAAAVHSRKHEDRIAHLRLCPSRKNRFRPK